MGLPLPLGKTHGKAKGTAVPDLLVMDVVNVQIIFKELLNGVVSIWQYFVLTLHL